MAVAGVVRCREGSVSSRDEVLDREVKLASSAHLVVLTSVDWILMMGGASPLRTLIETDACRQPPSTAYAMFKASTGAGGTVRGTHRA